MFSEGLERLAQLVTDRIASIRLDAAAGRLTWPALLKARSVLLKFGDPEVSFPFKGGSLRLPLSHDLPLIRAQYPGYSENLARVAGLVASKYPDLKVIDIGANVGDSVLLLREHLNLPILCVEGEPSYYELLEKNTRDFAHVERAQALVGPEDLKSGKLQKQSGTAMLDRAGEGGGRVRPLASILRDHVGFETSRLVKIDTDGMDCAILEDSQPWLREAQPVLFWEYFPPGWPKGRDGFRVFEALREIGYTQVVFYEASGGYLLSAALENRALLQDVHHRVLHHDPHRYVDVVAFPAKDQELAGRVRELELSRSVSL